MHRAIETNEPVCLICLEQLDPLAQICMEDCICLNCQKQFKLHKTSYWIHQKKWYVYYEYNDFLERLWFRYKEQRDIALAPIFLKDIDLSFFYKYCVCGLCSSEQKRMERGFEPLKELFEVQSIPFYSPLYKSENWKQNKLIEEKRNQISTILKKKEQYPLKNKKICLVDDMCTTGASLKAASDLLNPKVIFVLSAHPKWIEKHQKDQIKSTKKPWK